MCLRVAVERSTIVCGARRYNESIGFLFKQKTAYEMRISDGSSDVCSSDLRRQFLNRATIGADGKLSPGLPRPAVGRDARQFRESVERLEAIDQIGRASCRERVCQYV